MAKVTPSELKLGGRLALAAAVLTLAALVPAVAVQSEPGAPLREEFKLAYLLIIALITAATVQAYLIFDKALESLFSFHKARLLILALVGINAAMLGLETFLTLRNLNQQYQELQLVVILVYALLGIKLGLRLLGLENDLHGLRKPLCWLMIAEGLCLGTVVLAPVSILVNTAMMAVLGLVLLRSAGAGVQEG